MSNNKNQENDIDQLSFEEAIAGLTDIVDKVEHGQMPLQDSLDQYARIGSYHMVKLHDFLEKLRSVQEGDGTLLDHTLYLYGSGMGDPNVHDHTNLPIIVAGGAAGKMRGGRHIRYTKPTPLANLHLTLLDKVGVKLESFADSDGKVDELFGPLAV